MQRTLVQSIASRVEAIHNCTKSNNAEWKAKHIEAVQKLTSDHMPSGSGIDTGTTILWAESTGEKLVFSFSFHHMDENGSYDGWTEHRLIVRPAFQGVNLSISGRDRNQIKEYLHDTYHHALTQTGEY